MPRTYTRIALTASALTIALFASPSFADQVVVPAAQAAVEGNTSAALPFGGSFPVRYQQVYAANQFATGPQIITAIKLRLNASSSGMAPATIGAIRIDLSTTARTPDGLSLTFDDNVGPNNTTVFGEPGGSELTLSSLVDSSTSETQPFDIVIPLPTPFAYDPSQGNLLLDVRNFSGGLVRLFDAERTEGDGTSSINSGGNGVDAAVAPAADTSAGLVTAFDVQLQSTVVDTDGDGVADDEDVVPGSDTRAKVDVNGGAAGETTVDNIVDAEGRTIQDVVNQLAADARNHGQYVSAIGAFAGALAADGVITEQQAHEMQMGAARSRVGK